jgi:hypothetical protein
MSTMRHLVSPIAKSFSEELPSILARADEVIE